MAHSFKYVFANSMTLLLLAVGKMDGYQEGYPSCSNTECAQPSCCASCWGDFTVNVDFLYWRAFENGLEVCRTNCSCDDISEDGHVISSSESRSREPNFKWAPAFRIGVGYACNALYTELDWTHFYSKSSHKSHGSGLDWRVHYDVVDLLVGYNYKWNQSITVIPYLGVRGARINQHVSNIDFDCDASSEFGNHNSQKFDGVGPMLGIKADMNVWCGFGLYANLGAGELFGTYKIRSEEYSIFSDTENYCDRSKDIDASPLFYDAAVGVSWRKCFCNGMYVMLKLGVEQHRYFDYNRVGDCGDLSFEGGTLSAVVGF